VAACLAWGDTEGGEERGETRDTVVAPGGSMSSTGTRNARRLVVSVEWPGVDLAPSGKWYGRRMRPKAGSPHLRLIERSCQTIGGRKKRDKLQAKDTKKGGLNWIPRKSRLSSMEKNVPFGLDSFANKGRKSSRLGRPSGGHQVHPCPS